MQSKLYLGDCLDVLPTLEDQSVDMILTSPPYNMNLRIRNGKYCSRQIIKEISTKYTSFNDNLPIDEYFSFNKQVIRECLRVSDLVFYNIQFLTGNKPALFKLLGEFHNSIKEFIVWDKVNAQPAISEGVMNSQFEVLLVLQNSSPESRLFKTRGFCRGTLSNLWSIKRGKKYSKTHGATFPIELAEKVINNFSEESSIILDPFMGLGTTGVAAANLNRNFVGIELDEKYYAIARKRIQECKSHLTQKPAG
jgi:site-specific DNA-methyltransferase (adenine-specific)